MELLMDGWFNRLVKVEYSRSVKVPEYLLEGQILKLKLQYFGHLMQTAD